MSLFHECVPNLTSNCHRHECVTSHTLTWTISDFLLFPNSPGLVIDSPAFYSQCSELTQWQLVLCPNEDPESDFVFFKVRRLDSNRNIQPYLVECNVVLLQPAFQEVDSSMRRFRASPSSESPNEVLFRKSSLTDFLRSANVVDTLIFQYQIALRHCQECYVKLIRDVHLLELSANIQTLLGSGSLYDVYLQKDDTVISGQRCIIAARCPKLLEEPIEVSPGTLQKLVEYVYSVCTVPKLFFEKRELFDAAGRYNLMEVQQKLCQWAPKSYVETVMSTEYLNFVHTFSEPARHERSLATRKLNALTCKMAISQNGQGIRYLDVSFRLSISFPVLVCCEISLVDHQGGVIETFDASRQTFAENIIWRLPRIYERNNVEADPIAYDFLTPNSFKFRLTLCDGISASSCQQDVSYITEANVLDFNSLGRLSDDMGALFDSPRYYDIEVVFGWKPLNLHKCILWSRSQLFRELFEEQNIVLNDEFSRLTIDVEDIGDLTIDATIRYIYSGKVTAANLSDYRNLLRSARFFKLPTLVHLCETKIENMPL